MGSEEFVNPIKFSSITDMLVAIINVVIIMSIPVIIFFLILAGFHYVTAQGNPEKLKVASQSLLYSIIGGVIILASIAIMTIIKSVVGQF
jgi:hypothetical protein